MRTPEHAFSGHRDSADGFGRFREAIFRATRDLLATMTMPETEKELAFFNLIYGLPGPTSVARNRTPIEKHIGQIFQGFREISSSLEVMEDLSTVYIRRFPYRETSVSVGRHLQFVIEAYLHEIYILKARLERYARILAKPWKKSKEKPTATLLKACDVLVSNLKPIIDVRSQHVHQIRYSEPMLERIFTLELLLTASPKLSPAELASAVEWRALHKSAVRAARQKWIQTINDNERALNVILDKYFRTIWPLVFRGDGELIPLEEIK